MIFIPTTFLLIALINALPNIVINDIDKRSTIKQERECVSMSDNIKSIEEFERLRINYLGCTYVKGNLNIHISKLLNVTYDLSFLKTIRYVTGSVLLVGIIEAKVVCLDSLEIIRGNSTEKDIGNDYGLIVADNGLDNTNVTGLEELHMPNLKEISYGKVLIQFNPSLRFVETTYWRNILKERKDEILYWSDPFNVTVLRVIDRQVCPRGERWSNDTLLCQVGDQPKNCHEKCNGRCFGPGESECCHESCAVGCHGSSDEQCETCKDFKYETRCVGFCPDTTYPHLQNCVLKSTST